MARLVALLLLAMIGACRGTESPRVISLSPAASELLISLGARELLLGVDEVSRRDPGLAGLPLATLDLPGGLRSGADLLLLPPGVSAAAALALLAEPRAGGPRPPELVEVDPHSFEEAFSTAVAIGSRLGREQAALAWSRATRLALAEISARSFGRPRPRVAILVALDPMFLAGGHSFLTELVEIAGAESVTHGNEDLRVPTDPASLQRLAPDLVLVSCAEPLTHEQEQALGEGRVAGLRFARWKIDPLRVWAGAGPAEAAHLREQILQLGRFR